MSFVPRQATQNLVVGVTGTDRVALNFGANQINAVDVVNASATVYIFATFGDITVTTSATVGIPIAPNSRLILVPPLSGGVTHLALVAASTTAQVYTTVGRSVS